MPTNDPMETLISRSEMIAYRSNILQALEELKLRRSESLDRQNATEKLIAEKLTAEQSLEAKCERLKQAEQTISNLKRKLNEAAAKVFESKHKDENLQLKVALEAAESTVLALKKDIGMISIQRHQLEVNLKQSEQKAASRDSQVNGLIERIQCLEKAGVKISKQLDDYEKTQALLQKNFESASSVNKDLIRARTYTECILDNSRKETESLKQKVKELNKKIEQQKEIIQQEQNSNKGLTEDITTIQEELNRTRKIVACSTCDDKSVIELENSLRESDEKAKVALSELQSLSERFKKVKMESEKQVADAVEEMEKLKTLLKEAADKEADLQGKVSDLKEAKLTIQELKIQLDSLVKKNQSQCAELEESQRKILEYEKITKEANPCKMSNSECQTEANHTVGNERCCQTESMMEEQATQTLLSSEATSLDHNKAEYSSTEKSEASEKMRKDTHDIAKEMVMSVNEEANLQQITLHDMTGEKPEGSCPKNQPNVDCMEQSQSISLDDSPIKPSDCIILENPCENNLRTVVSSERDVSSKSADCLLFDCAHLHGEDVIASSSQEELSVKNILEKPLTKFKTPFAADNSCSYGFVKETMVSKDLPSSVKPSEKILCKSPLLKEGDSDKRPKSHARKRKLAASPPMLDLSQPSAVEDVDSPECGSKQIPLRSLKNFTKQVLTNKPAVKSCPRFTPLSLLSGPSGSLNLTSNYTGRETLPRYGSLYKSTYSVATRSPLQNVANCKDRVEAGSSSDVEIDESE